jgi:hypothetical protein
LFTAWELYGGAAAQESTGKVVRQLPSGTGGIHTRELARKTSMSVSEGERNARAEGARANEEVERQ